jgi:hypothetical protein
MFEISYLNHFVRAIPVKTGWRVVVLDLTTAAPAQCPVYQSSAVYPTETDAIAAGVQFVQRQQALAALWQFLHESYDSGIITETELNHLSASVCFFCSFKDFHSDYGYWYR